jgi:hypothetical protein
VTISQLSDLPHALFRVRCWSEASARVFCKNYCLLIFYRIVHPTFFTAIKGNDGGTGDQKHKTGGTGTMRRSQLRLSLSQEKKKNEDQSSSCSLTIDIVFPCHLKNGSSLVPVCRGTSCTSSQGHLLLCCKTNSSHNSIYGARQDLFVRLTNVPHIPQCTPVGRVSVLPLSP